MQKELTVSKREQGYLSKQMEEKENVIDGLQKDLRSVKDKLNEEKIRHRRSQVMQSRIPAPSTGARSANAPTRKPISSQQSAMTTRQTSRTTTSSSTNGTKRTVRNMTTVPDSPRNDPAYVRAQVLKMLQEHDPTKVDKLDNVMEKFKGREGELLEKMTARYENDGMSAASMSVASISRVGSTEEDDDRPKSRQDKALARHMARMNRLKGSG